MSDFWKTVFDKPLGLKVLKATTTKREGQPWLQGTARNLGHELLGDDNAYDFERKWLGDTQEGWRYPRSAADGGTGMQPGAQGPTPTGFAALQGIPPDAAMSAVGGGQPPQDTPTLSQRPQYDEILKRLMQQQALGGGTGGFMISPQ